MFDLQKWSSNLAITVGSKGHTTLKVGQTISRRIVDGDVVFLNRPLSTHKHSLQAFYVYVKSCDKLLGKFQVCHLHSFDNTRLNTPDYNSPLNSNSINAFARVSFSF